MFRAVVCMYDVPSCTTMRFRLQHTAATTVTCRIRINQRLFFTVKIEIKTRQRQRRNEQNLTTTTIDTRPISRMLKKNNYTKKR